MQEEEILDFRSPVPDVKLFMKGMDRLPQALADFGFTSLREGQAEAVNAMLSGQDTIFIFPTSWGKCLAWGTKVIMYDGSVKEVQDITAGELLLGPDSLPRKVVSTCSGREEMFRVTPRRGGDPYVVNKGHTLSFKLTAGGKKGDRIYDGNDVFSGGDIVNFPVQRYLDSSPTFKHRAKGWKCDAVEFAHKAELNEDLPPYLLGLWLGDGSSAGPIISKPDKELEDYLKEYGRSRGMRVHDIAGQERPSGAMTLPGISGGCKGGSNPLRNALKAYDLLDNKHIPDEYKRASLQERLELLAGLMDADGILRETGNAYEILTKFADLAEDILFVARSCGFHASVNEKRVKLSGWDEPRLYKRIYLSGDIGKLPCRISRKKAGATNSRTNPSVFSIKVESVGEGDYYGFSLEGPDRLFMLGDFTVTHNSATFVIPALCHDWRLLVFSPLKALMRDQVRSLQTKGLCALSLSSDNTETENSRAIADWVKGDCKILFVAPERLKNEEFDRALRQAPPHMVVCDEAQCLSNWGDNFRHSYKYIGYMIEKYKPRVVAACTATLPRKFEEDVRRVMRIPEAKRIFHFPVRKNLILSSSDLDAYNDLVERVQSIDGKVLVYCGSQEKTVNTAKTLSKKLNEEVGFYHADVQEATKKMNQDGFYSGRIRVMCATNAFGMGIDIEDIRSVIHLMHPADPEALSQEIGRAGRDGKESWCHTYESRDAMRMNEGFLMRGHPSEDYYKRVFRFMSKKADKEGLFHLTGKEIEEGSGVYIQYQAAIMQNLLGERVLEDATDVVRMHKIRFLTDSELGRFIQLEDKITSSKNGIGALENGWWHFDMDLLAQRMELSRATISKYLKDWQAQSLVSYEAPPSGKAKRIIGDLSLVDFERLAIKREDAYNRLKYVAGYFTTPDHSKHDYLQNYFINL